DAVRLRAGRGAAGHHVRGAVAPVVQRAVGDHQFGTGAHELTSHRAGLPTSRASITAPAELSEGRLALMPRVSSSRPTRPATPYRHWTSCSTVRARTAQIRARKCMMSPLGLANSSKLATNSPLLVPTWWHYINNLQTTPVRWIKV